MALDRHIPSAVLFAGASGFVGCALGIPLLFQNLKAGVVLPAKYPRSLTWHWRSDLRGRDGVYLARAEAGVFPHCKVCFG